MFDDRFFDHVYARYEPTVSTSAAGDDALSEGAAAASNLACHLIRDPGRWRADERGIDLPYDARLLLPNDQTLQPEAVGDQPHHVEVQADGVIEKFVVLVCWTVRGQYRQALLQMRRP